MQIEGERLDSNESSLLTAQQLREASSDQLENLVQRLNLALRERGLPGLVRSQPPNVILGEPAPGESPENPASD